MLTSVSMVMGGHILVLADMILSWKLLYTCKLFEFH